MLSTGETIFDALSAEARACSICPRMTDRTAVLSRLNGCLTPRVLFVAEAPGRQGADRTRIPLTGDASARAFNHLLARVDLDRDDIFITNAVMCNPHTETGANRPPSQPEVRNCNSFLRRTIDLLDPPIVVTLGAKALAALSLIESHGLTVAGDASRCAEWYGRKLIPVYHPSPQVLISRRSLAQQESDWQAIRATLMRLP